MTPTEVRKLWTAALRSGEYTQGTNSLRSKNDEYCCLGVLCDLAVKEGVISDPTPLYGAHGAYGYGREDAGAFVPAEVQKWVGLIKKNGGYDNGSLILLNDGAERKNFSQIADVIDSAPDKLFLPDAENISENA